MLHAPITENWSVKTLINIIFQIYLEEIKVRVAMNLEEEIPIQKAENQATKNEASSQNKPQIFSEHGCFKI